jgi:hypothetical protein
MSPLTGPPHCSRFAYVIQLQYLHARLVRQEKSGAVYRTTNVYVSKPVDEFPAHPRSNMVEWAALLERSRDDSTTAKARIPLQLLAVGCPHPTSRKGLKSLNHQNKASRPEAANRVATLQPVCRHIPLRDRPPCVKTVELGCMMCLLRLFLPFFLLVVGRQTGVHNWQFSVLCIPAHRSVSHHSRTL